MHPYQHSRQKSKESSEVECHPDFNVPVAKPKRPNSLYRVTCQQNNIKPGALKEAMVISCSADHAKMGLHVTTGYTAERIPDVQCQGQEGRVLMAIYYAPEQKENA